MSAKEPKFKIGQQFWTRGKHPDLCVVTDVLRTYNAAGDLIRTRYVAEHCGPLGQVVEDCDVCETTVAMGAVLIP